VPLPGEHDVSGDLHRRADDRRDVHDGPVETGNGRYHRNVEGDETAATLALWVSPLQ
jgi:hypothetical protein